MDKRLGRNTEWPETTVSGHPYERPASTLGLGNGYFVVLDVFIKPSDDLIADVTAAIPSAKKKAKPNDEPA